MTGRKIGVLILMFCAMIVMTMIFVYSYSDESEETSNLAEETTVVTSEENIIEEIAKPEEEVDPYAHVRFGERRDILLLDVEWHTYDSYKEEVIDTYEARMKEFFDSEYFVNLPKDQQDAQRKNYETIIKDYNRSLNRIRSGRVYAARTINGENFVNQNGSFTLWLNDRENISDLLDSDGYYIYKVYPYYATVSYTDENGEFQWKNFGTYGNDYVGSKREYEYVLEHDIIPLCDELLAKGLITQEIYDMYTIADPLDKYIDTYFNFKYIYK